MKKLLYFLMLLPMMLLASCSDDDSMPDADITATLSNVYLSDNGRLFALKDSKVSLDQLSIKGNGGKTALISSVQYVLNNRIIGWSQFSPFSVDFIVNGTGICPFQLNMEILQEDKSVAIASLELLIYVVPTKEDLPENMKITPEDGPVALTYTISANPK